MAKRQKPADAAKDKAAKQKKLAILLVLVLVLAMAYAFMTMQGLNSSNSSSKPQAAPTASSATTNPTTPAPTASPTPVAPTLAGAPVAAVDPAAAAAAGTSPTGSTQLVSAVSPPADAGQLQSFSLFESKDPFANGAGSKPVSSSSGGSSGGGSGTSSGGSSGTKPASPPVVPPAPPSPPPTAAVISVNGVSESVTTGGNFPMANPDTTANGLFQLISLTGKTAIISVVGGSYASGSHTLTLKVNKAVTLVNTADGTRYTIQLYPQGTVAPAAPAGASSGSSSSGSSSGSSTTTTTPATPSPGN